MVWEYDTSVGLLYFKIRGIYQVHSMTIDVTRKPGVC